MTESKTAYIIIMSTGDGYTFDSNEVYAVCDNEEDAKRLEKEAEKECGEWDVAFIQEWELNKANGYKVD
jgi:hypothetical protein